MADALRTFTVDTASSPWVLSDGTVTTISGTAETFVLQMRDLGTTANYEGGQSTADGQIVTLGNGKKIKIGADKRFTFLGTFENTVAKVNPGSIWVEEDEGGRHVEVKVTTAEIADADGTGNDNITSITFEYPGTPFQWTWANIKMA
jgi:hypothetical protein